MTSTVTLAPGQYEYEKGLILNRFKFPPTSIDKVKEFPFKKGDVVIAAYPKCGTTWISQIMSLIFNNGDTKTENMAIDIQRRVPYMEIQLNPMAPANVDVLANIPAPRLMKVHMPAHIMRKGIDEGDAKFIVCMRNVKDCLVSYYHFYRAIANFSGTFDDFFEIFKAKSLNNGDWLEYSLGWWAERHRPNVLIVKYEDLKRNPREEVLKCADFCGASFSAEVIEKILQESTFEQMKNDPLANMSSLPKHAYNSNISPFMRKGTVGDWQNYFDEEQSAYVDKHYTAKAAKAGLEFDFEL